MTNEQKFCEGCKQLEPCYKKQGIIGWGYFDKHGQLTSKIFKTEDEAELNDPNEVENILPVC